MKTRKVDKEKNQKETAKEQKHERNKRESEKNTLFLNP
jgi:hypothetical protein